MPFFFFSQLHILDFYPEGMANSSQLYPNFKIYEAFLSC